MQNNTQLFEEYMINNRLKLKNRTVVAPVYLGFHGHSKEFFEYYSKRVKGGAGLMIIPQSTENSLESWNDETFAEGFKPLINEAHKYGVKIVLQTYEGIEDINNISIEELEIIPKKYVKAAKAIQKAGFDGFEIHGAHYTPFAAFLSSNRNRRDDSYGLDFNGKAKIILDTVKAIKESVPDLPLFYRLSACDFVENGISIKTSIQLALKLEKLGIDCLDISAGTTESSDDIIFPKRNRSSGCYAPLIQKIKDRVNIPIIGVGKIDSREIAEKIIINKQADLIAIGRGLIADPDIIYKMQNNLDSEINKCLYCNKGCLDNTLFKGKPISCSINPYLFDNL